MPDMRNRRAENRLLLYTSLDCETNPRIDDTVRSSITGVRDWEYLFASLMHHGTILSFMRHVKRLELSHALPDAHQERLLRTALVLRYRNGRFFEEMRKIASAFQKSDVPLVFIKGAALVIAEYYERDARFMEDMDCVVPPAYAGRTRELLERAGYELPIGVESTRLGFKGEVEFVNKQDREMVVEVAIRLNKNYELSHCYPFPSELPSSAVSRETVDGVAFSLPEKEFHVAYCLFHHAALNYLHRLNWLNDLYLMTSDPELDVQKVEAYVGKYGLERSWVLLNSMLRRHFDLPSLCGEKKSPAALKKIFLDDSCAFAELHRIEPDNVAIRMSLIGNGWKRLLVVLKKVILPSDWLRTYYKKNADTPVLAIYMIHYVNSLKRLLRIR